MGVYAVYVFATQQDADRAFDDLDLIAPSQVDRWPPVCLHDRWYLLFVWDGVPGVPAPDAAREAMQRSGGELVDEETSREAVDLIQPWSPWGIDLD